MEVPLNEDSELPASADAVHQQQDNVLPDTINGGTMEQKQEITEVEVSGTLEAIASAGKFWHDWEKLKSMLSFQLKQVLSEYPEAKTSGEQQSTLGETFPELVKRLDEALLSFIDGPPFTLQRICEILLDARSIYPNLSKLALALEKNLLVTSTLAISSDPRLPSSDPKPNELEEPEIAVEEQKHFSDAVENGIEPIAGDRDEVMAEVEEADMNDGMTMDMEALVGSSETNSAVNNNS
ncbi:serine/threonine-protein phosphatase 4 regulatory subunit 2-B-like [Cucurbita maxima]|uniref:Serine/threonine-protein phosphatase 4 regulatory subunit 2-B-like n=1 Tax=Cucurbita maxima TaxID=3661 RepID=A0A6J1J9V8_CUCMA|nr:serine/threonine-protein phosphatase 4 regulatory subunit 2-B-like [Cucurbita maxima]XP_022984226.1 serine/threonine-protein phosphatase 4 regulatory subunit 2-B-like [Cucurbita maxima]XP_022984227.1 serine/threonine-protein phosphatase 4 regulatory subunit 2-B-like [Cucurbita maxima]XP_022984228.1 serine/threonine-protein phosphatase 4 regulatory subunit 2-B-like [Cucurbita maxima]XP_022984229.1 serine/threonine-protein phosphatase 4 regulatory subunit 2-B-like [Cucurbita maxima]XP_0229842